MIVDLGKRFSNKICIAFSGVTNNHEELLMYEKLETGKILDLEEVKQE